MKRMHLFYFVADLLCWLLLYLLCYFYFSDYHQLSNSKSCQFANRKSPKGAVVQKTYFWPSFYSATLLARIWRISLKAYFTHSSIRRKMVQPCSFFPFILKASEKGCKLMTSWKKGRPFSCSDIIHFTLKGQFVPSIIRVVDGIQQR